MSDPYMKAKNSAGDFATVGVQAETFIHGDVYYYVVREDAPAEEKFQVGIRYLNGGVPSEALRLIERAMAEGLDTSEARFYWLIALLSGRTYRQFSPEDTTRINHLRKHPVVCHNDPWSEGIRVTLRLLDSLREPGVDPGPFISAINDLRPGQRAPVLRHLAVFLKGPLGDQVWRLEVQAAEDDRYAQERERRVGLFFQPSPAKPQPRRAAPAAFSSKDGIIGFTAATVFVIMLINIGWELIRHGSIGGVLGYVVGCTGLCIAGASWVEYRWQARRRAEHNATDFRCFGPVGMLSFSCSARSLMSVSGLCEGMISARVSPRGQRAVPRAAGPGFRGWLLLPVAGSGPGVSRCWVRTR